MTRSIWVVLFLAACRHEGIEVEDVDPPVVGRTTVVAPGDAGPLYLVWRDGSGLHASTANGVPLACPHGPAAITCDLEATDLDLAFDGPLIVGATPGTSTWLHVVSIATPLTDHVGGDRCYRAERLATPGCDPADALCSRFRLHVLDTDETRDIDYLDLDDVSDETDAWDQAPPEFLAYASSVLLQPRPAYVCGTLYDNGPAQVFLDVGQLFVRFE